MGKTPTGMVQNTWLEMGLGYGNLYLGNPYSPSPCDLHGSWQTQGKHLEPYLQSGFRYVLMSMSNGAKLQKKPWKALEETP